MSIKKSIVINLSFDPAYVQEQLSNRPDLTPCSIIDFTGVCETIENLGIEVLLAREVDMGNKAEMKAMREYVETVGSLSMLKLRKETPVRGIQILGLHIFWLTPFSIKHHPLHWAYTLFYFKEFLRSYPELFSPGVKLLVIVPENMTVEFDHFRGFLETMEDKEIIRLGGEGKRRSATSIWKAVLKFIYRYVSSSYRVSGIESDLTYFDEQPAFVILTDPYVVAKRTGPVHKTVLNLKKFFFQKNQSTVISIDTFSINYPASRKGTGYLKASRPGIRQVISIIRGVLHAYSTINKNKQCFTKQVKEQPKRPIEYLLPGVLAEMEFLLSEIDTYFQYLWLSNYFKKFNSKCKIFFEDEFYSHGRMISAAARNSGNHYIVTYGLQHGLISAQHVVYRIGKKEMDDSFGEKDKTPLPDYFLVWGEYFKKQFEEFNYPLYSSRILIAGNPFYIKKKENNSANKNILNIENRRRDKKAFKILWCTTLSTAMLYEYAVMSRFLLQRDNWELTIRMHPGWNIRKEIMATMNISAYNRSVFENEVTLESQIERHDVVVCTGWSTVFVDVMFLEKPVIRIHNSLSIPGYLDLTVKGLYNVFNAVDFENSLEDIASIENFHYEIPEHFLYLKSDRWKEILEN